MAGTIQTHITVHTKPVSGRGEQRGALTNLAPVASACEGVWGQGATR